MLSKKLGILGGGQLGRMLIQKGIDYDLTTYVMDAANAPAREICSHFVEGSLMDYDQVYQFGKQVDVLTIEIEHVNADALETLENEGLAVYPRPHALKTIQDKGLQKEFYAKHNIPSSPYTLLSSKDEISQYPELLPAFQKLRKFGYDGKGVVPIKDANSLQDAFTEPSVLEKMVDIEKEISVIVTRNANGQSAVFPVVELVFNPVYNLVDYLISPADVSAEQEATAKQLALQVVNALDSPGIFAVEMFLDKQGDILVNETAPRTHNSGHASIEGNISSQYDQQIRALLNLPPGSTDITQPSLMLNLIGSEGHTGPAKYQGIEQAMAIAGVYVHLYGKKETRPGRKMGHVTILGSSREELIQKAQQVKETLKVIA